MADQATRLKNLKKQFATANEEKIKLSTQLDMAKKTRKETVQKIKDKGLEPKQLKTVIADKQTELNAIYDEVEQHLPGDADADFDMDDDE